MPGAGWAVANAAVPQFEFFMQLLDVSKGVAWHVFRDNTPKPIQISPYSKQAGVDSCMSNNRMHLFFLGESGIERLQCDTELMDTIIPVDVDKHEIADLRVSGDGDTLYYSARRRTMPLFATLNELTPAVGSNSTARDIIRVDLRSTPLSPVKCGVVPADTSPFGFDLSRMEIIGIGDGHKFRQMSLVSGEWRTFGKIDRVAQGLNLISQGGILIWGFSGHRDSGIFLFNDSGEEVRRISIFGFEPSSSPNRQFVAFLTKNGVWISDHEQRPANIFRLNPAPKTRTGGPHRRISWCDCGRHFAVTVDDPGMAGPTPWKLMIADVDRRIIFLYPYSPIDFQWRACRQKEGQ